LALSIGLDTAVKALRVHQLAVDVASHNIANVNSPGFSRQRALLRPMGLEGNDRFAADGLIGRTGFGVEAREVSRVRDMFLDYQARGAMTTKSEFDLFSQALTQTESVFNDPSDDGLSGLFQKFWAAWHDVVNDPESPAGRTTLVHSTTTLTTRIQRAYSELTRERADLDRQVSDIGGRINAAATELADLNLRVKQVELNGENANDLRDRRDLLLDQLSQLGQISYQEEKDHSVSVYFGDHELVTGNIARTVMSVADPANAGMSKLVFQVDSGDVTTTTGELRGLLDARDSAIPTLMGKLDQLANGLISSINAVHQAGFGLDGTTGLDFLTGTGAQDIALNAVLAANPHQIAAAAALNAPGDGSNALAIANLQLAATMSGATETFDDFYANTVSVLGADVARARGVAQSGELLLAHLDQMRQSVSGVNLDEEMTNLNSSQHAYNAAARVITTIDDMLDVLINKTGIVGR
jgi:flagellar hook-associated protein 1 FlgK